MVSSKYSTAKTGVLWDLEYCPIPDGLTPASVSRNIKLALVDMGYTGEVDITAYSVTEQKKKDFDTAGISLSMEDNRRAKRINIFWDAYAWGRKHIDKPSNLMMISGDISNDGYYITCLRELKVRENNILLAQPQAAVGLLRTVPSSFWLWSSLSAGGSPIDDNQSGSSSHCIKKSLGVSVKKKKNPLDDNQSGSSSRRIKKSLSVSGKKKKKPLAKKQKRKMKKALEVVVLK